MSASSPEELEALLEDAVLLGDEAAVLSLFDAGAVLITGPRVTGPETALAELATLEYVAATRTVAERRDLAVLVGEQAANVSCRAPDGVWRLVAVIVRTPRDSMSPACRNRHQASMAIRAASELLWGW
jgi:hypothetical protein